MLWSCENSLLLSAAEVLTLSLKKIYIYSCPKSNMQKWHEEHLCYFSKLIIVIIVITES